MTTDNSQAMTARTMHRGQGRAERSSGEREAQEAEVDHGACRNCRPKLVTTGPAGAEMLLTRAPPGDGGAVERSQVTHIDTLPYLAPAVRWVIWLPTCASDSKAAPGAARDRRRSDDRRYIIGGEALRLAWPRPRPVAWRLSPCRTRRPPSCAVGSSAPWSVALGEVGDVDRIDGHGSVAGAPFSPPAPCGAVLRTTGTVAAHVAAAAMRRAMDWPFRAPLRCPRTGAGARRALAGRRRGGRRCGPCRLCTGDLAEPHDIVIVARFEAPLVADPDRLCDTSSHAKNVKRPHAGLPDK